jgi:catechol 2,3-dioxygenase-like lactoylglutathione lyase family enzyme
MSLKTPFASVVMVLVLSVGTAATTLGQAAPVGRQFIGLSVPDAPAAASWYQKAFGVSVLHEIKDPDGQAHVFILGSDTLLIELLQHRDAKPPDAAAHESKYLVHGVFKVGFYVADLDKAVVHLRGLGAEFVTNIVDNREQRLRFVLVRDLNGNVIQLLGTPQSDPK